MTELRRRMDDDMLASGVAHRRRTIACAQQLPGVTPTLSSADTPPAADVDRARCPLCYQGHWQVVEILRPVAPSLAPLTADTS